MSIYRSFFAVFLLLFIIKFECLLESEKLVANVVTDLDGVSVLKLEFFAASILQNRLTLFVCTLVFSAPFFMLVDQRK